MIAHALDKFPPHLLVVAAARNLFIQFLQPAAELLVRFLPAGEANDVHPGRQFTINGEVVECRDQLAVGEITRSPKNDDSAWLRAAAGNEIFTKRIGHGTEGSFTASPYKGKRNQVSGRNTAHAPRERCEFPKRATRQTRFPIATPQDRASLRACLQTKSKLTAQGSDT